MRQVNLAGREVGLLHVQHRTERRGGKWFWLCTCACGGSAEVCARYLLKAQRNSCGCQDSRATIGLRALKHGEARVGAQSIEYHTWGKMLSRCRNKDDSSYKDYGGRGITVDSRWDSFEAFLTDMGRRPSPTHSVERVKNELGYSKENCIWATKEVQANNKRNNRVLEYRGERLTLMQLAKKYFPAEPAERARCRIQRRVDSYGFTLEQAVLLPVQTRTGRPLLSQVTP